MTDNTAQLRQIAEKLELNSVTTDWLISAVKQVIANYISQLELLQDEEDYGKIDLKACGDYHEEI